MKKQHLVIGIVFLAVAGLTSSSASAQKLHAPKQVWQAMIAGLSDIQSMTGALMVFDMTSIESTATALAAREDFISKIDEKASLRERGHDVDALAAE